MNSASHTHHTPAQHKRLKVVIAYVFPTLLIAIFLVVKQPYGGLELPLRFRNAVELTASIPIGLAFDAGLIPRQEIWSEITISVIAWTILILLLVCTRYYRLPMRVHIGMGLLLLAANLFHLLSTHIY